MANRGKVRRISDDLDAAIRNMASTNNIKYIDATREASKILNSNRGKIKLIKEIKW